MNHDSPWVRNPSARIRRIVQGDQVVAFQVFAPVPRRGLQITKVTEDLPDAFRVLHQITAERRSSGELDDAILAELVRLGILVEPHRIPRPAALDCWLPAESDSGSPAPAGLGWNQGLERCLPGELPARWPAPLPADTTLLLTPDPCTGIRIPALVPSSAPWLASWAAGEPPQLAPSLPWEELQAAGLLVTPGPVTPAFGEAHARFFDREGYVILRGVLPRAMLRILQPYYRDLVAQGHLPLGDGQSDRYAAHNEKWARWLHLELERSLRPVAPGHKASYSYLGSYVAGAILARHTDREQCGLTASVCIDEEGPDPDFHWPLGLEDRAGQDVKATLLPGDALLFRGTELPHYREQLPSGCSYTSIFFHFVHNEFQGSLD